MTKLEELKAAFKAAWYAAEAHADAAWTAYADNREELKKSKENNT